MKEKIIQHICALIVFVGCITTVVVLLSKYKIKDETVDIDYDAEVTFATAVSAVATTSKSKFFFLRSLFRSVLTIFFLIDNLGFMYWSLDASLMYNRANHEAVLLRNGKVMVSGGRSDPFTIIKICELYSPSTGWQPGAVMKMPRFYNTLTSFANGTKVLAAGSAEPTSQATAEVYDSTNDTWTSTATNMLDTRFAHAATLLQNEQILIMGGINASNFIISSTEFFISSANSFIKGNNMNIGRALFTSTLLHDGSVLVTGGGDINRIMTQTAELYISNSWSFTNNKMIQARAYHAAVLLPNGDVLIAGGGNGISISFATAEIYNAATRTFTPVGSMKYRRAAFTLTLLPSGKVLATGGTDWTTYTYPDMCELYDPITQTWSNTQQLNNGRSFHRSVLLPDSVLTIGGYTADNSRTGTCEKYKF